MYVLCTYFRWWRYGDGDMIKYEEGESYESKMHRMANRIRVVLVNSKLEVIGSTEEFSSRGTAVVQFTVFETID